MTPLNIIDLFKWSYKPKRHKATTHQWSSTLLICSNILIKQANYISPVVLNTAILIQFIQSAIECKFRGYQLEWWRGLISKQDIINCLVTSASVNKLYCDVCKVYIRDDSSPTVQLLFVFVWLVIHLMRCTFSALRDLGYCETNAFYKYK